MGLFLNIMGKMQSSGHRTGVAGGGGETRTRDKGLMSPLLCHLSYPAVSPPHSSESETIIIAPHPAGKVKASAKGRKEQ